MSRNTKPTFRLTALAAALLAVYGHAIGAENPESPVSGSVSVGVGNWSNDRAQQGIYDGMRESGTYGLFDADLLKRDDTTGTRLGLKARNLGLDNREIGLDWMRQGNIGASLEYSRIPRDQAFIYNTGVQGIGTTTLLVPTPSIVPGSGSNVELGTARDRITAKFFKKLGEGLNFNASFRNETKDGTRPWGRGGAPEFAVEPIDSTIRIFDAMLNYSREGLQLSGGYYGTQYDNANSMVTTSLTNGTNPFFLSLPLSNQSHELFLNGGYNFTPTARGTLKASYSRATQNEALGNFGGTASPLAPASLDGKLDTTLLEAGVTAKPTPKLSIVGNLRYRDFADKTPVQGVVFTGTTPTVYNTPFSYTNTIGKLEATYRLPEAFNLLGGMEYNAQDRQVPSVGTLWVPFRASLDETTYRLQLRRSMSETVNGSLAYLHSTRDGSSYTPASNPAGEPLQQAINPLNIADRTRDKWRAMVDWSPADKLSFQFALEDAKDDYGGPNAYGLQEGTGRLYSVDGSYQFNSTWQIHAWFTRDENKANEITQNSATVTKFNDLSEVGDSFGLGVTGKISSKLKVGAKAEQFRSVNKYNQSIVGGTLPATQVPTPDITNTLLRFNLFADVPVQKNADVRINLIHEKWSTDDWSWTMFPASGPTPWAYGTTTDGTTVTANPKQNSTFVGIRYIYRFQ
jgi:MtrB/PioB family decaheme-associated outer membrane protein